MDNTNNTDTDTTKGSYTDMDEEEQMKKLDRDMFVSALQQGIDVEEENKASRLGLWQVYAYHCLRCHHVWFPRWISGYHPYYFKELLFAEEPPKSCAKCKSKYWNRIPQRDEY
jgi:hypothetical protein